MDLAGRERDKAIARLHDQPARVVDAGGVPSPSAQATGCPQGVALTPRDQHGLDRVVEPAVERIEQAAEHVLRGGLEPCQP